MRRLFEGGVLSNKYGTIHLIHIRFSGPVWIIDLLKLHTIMEAGKTTKCLGLE